MNKLAIYIENNGIEKSAGILDRLFKRSYPENPLLPKLKEFGDFIAKQQGKLYDFARTPPKLDTSLGTNLNVSSAIGKRYAKIENLNAHYNNDKYSPYKTYFGGKESPLARVNEAKREVEATNKYTDLGFTMEKKTSHSWGGPETYLEHMFKIKKKEADLPTLLKRQAEADLVAALDKYPTVLEAQKRKAAILKPSNSHEERVKRTLVDEVLRSRKAGREATVPLTGNSGEFIKVKVKEPLEAGERGVHFDVEHMFGVSPSALTKKLDKRADELRNLGRDKTVDQESELKHLDSFRKKFSKKLNESGSLAYGDLNKITDIITLVKSPLLKQKVSSHEAQTIIEGVLDTQKAHKIENVGEALKLYLGQQGQMGGIHAPAQKIFKNKRMSSEQTKKLYEDVFSAKQKPYDELVRAAGNAASVGIVGTGAVAAPYFFYKGYKNRSNERS